MSEFQTDALRPSSLPTASLGRRRHFDDTNAQNEEGEKFGKVAEDWNVRIDKEVKAVSTGLKELIELADVSLSPAPSLLPSSLCGHFQNPDLLDDNIALTYRTVADKVIDRGYPQRRQFPNQRPSPQTQDLPTYPLCPRHPGLSTRAQVDVIAE